MAASGASIAFDDRPSVAVLFGDSISVGENVSSYYQECPAANPPFGNRPGRGTGIGSFCTPDRELQRLSIEARRPTITVNHGFGGTTSSFGASRIIDDLRFTRSRLPDGKSYFVLILYGTNDVFDAIPPDAIAANIRTMISRARGEGWIPVIGNLLPRTGPDVSAANNAIRAAAIESGAAFVDQFSNYQAKGGINLHDNEDGLFGSPILRLHPKREGYTIVAQQWMDGALESLIEPFPLPFTGAPIFLLLDDNDEDE